MLTTYNPNTGLSTLPAMYETLLKGGSVRARDWPDGFELFVRGEALFLRPGADKDARPYAARMDDLTECKFEEVLRAE